MKRTKNILRNISLKVIAVALFAVMLPTVAFAYADQEALDTSAFGFTNSSLTAVFDSENGSAVFVADDSIELTAKGYKILWTAYADTTKLYIKNNASKKMVLSFTLDTSELNGGTYNVGGASDADGDGVYEVTLSAGDSYEISVNSKKENSHTASISLSNITLYSNSASINFCPMDSSLGTYSVDGTEITSVTSIDYTKTSIISLPDVDGYNFAAWMYCNSDGTMNQTLYTTEASFLPKDDVTIAPLYVPEGNALYSVDGTVYYTWQTAMTAAAANVTSNGSSMVTLLGDGTLSNNLNNNTPDGTYVRNDGTATEPKLVYQVPEGVKFLIPYGAADTGSFGPSPENYISQETSHAMIDSGGIAARNYVYRSLTVAAGAKIECYGSINVNGRRQSDGQSFTGVPLGGYGKLILGTEYTGAPETDEDKLEAQLIIKGGGALYAYGYITGTGLVNAENNAAVHEFLQIACWPGGTNAENWNGLGTSNNMMFLLTEYYIQNIEAPMRISYGATHTVEAAITVSSSLFGTITKAQSTPFITTSSTSNPGLFLLSETDSYVLRIYDVEADRMNYYMKGGAAEIGTISVSITADLGISSENYILPINHSLTLIADEGAEITVAKKVALLPGAELIIKEGATVNLQNQLYVFDVGDYTNNHFFNRATNMDVDATNKSPNHCPAPYVATLNNVSPKVNYIFTGVLTGTLGSTDTYYVDIINITNSAKLQVDGTLNITGSGALCTTNGKSNSDKGVIGSGMITNNGTPVDLDMKVGKDGSPATVNATYGLGNLAGVGTLKAFATGTYYGQSNGYWYNYVVQADSADNFGKFTPSAVTGLDGNTVSRYNSSTKTQDTISNVLGLVSYYWNGSASVQSAFDFDMDAVDGSGLSLSGGGDSVSVTPSMDVSNSVLHYVLSGVGADVTLGTSTDAPTTIQVTASNADNVPFYSMGITFPSCTDLCNFYSDAACTTAASDSNLGGTVYISGGEAVAAIAVEIKPAEGDPTRGDYVQAFMKVSEAVAAATGNNTYVVVLQDRTLTDAIVVAEGQNITLDLGGKTLTGKVATVFAGAKSQKLVTNNGILRLINGKITFDGSFTQTEDYSETNFAATLYNLGTIEYIENVTLEETAANIYLAALLNGSSGTIKEIRSGTLKGASGTAGTAILNHGTINTIGTSGKTVEIIGRRAVLLYDGRIDTIGGEGSTVTVTSNQRGIEVAASGASIGTIGMSGSTVNITMITAEMGRYAIYASSGPIEVIGGEGSTINITYESGPIYTQVAIWVKKTPASGAVIIGDESSTIIINAQMAVSEDYADKKYDLIGIRNGATAVIGASGSRIYINVAQNGSGTAKGIYNTGTITSLGADDATIEIVSNYNGIYNSGTINEIRGNLVGISTATDTSYYALYNKGTIGMIYSGDFRHDSGNRANAVYNPDSQNYPVGCGLSTVTREVTVGEDSYKCYYVHSHSYTDEVCTACGVFKFHAVNVNLGNNLDMMFAFSAELRDSWNGCYVIFTHNGKKSDPIDVSDLTLQGISGGVSTEGKEYYVVSYGFAAKEMCDTVTVTVYDNNDKAISESRSDSIQAYAMRMLARAEANTQSNLKKLIVDMLNYGAACQKYFDSTEDEKCANSLLSDTQKGYATQNLTLADTTTKGNTWRSSNLVTTSNIQFAIAFQDIENKSLTYTVTGHKGNVISGTEANITTDANGNPHILLTELVVADARCVITFTVDDSKWTESIYAYVSRNAVASEDDSTEVAAQKEALRAFMKFADSANAYLHDRNG